MNFNGMNALPSTETLRLFLAISIPEAVRSELRRLQQELRPLLPPRVVRWANPEQFHLTLKFLGNVPAADTAALSEAARAVCAAAPPLRLRAQNAGFFPNELSPRVFWVDIKSQDNLLLELQQKLERATGRFGEKQEARNFAAHVTLARLGKLRRPEEAGKFAERALTDKIFGEWTAREVELVRSQLSPSGAVHTAFAAFKTKYE